VVAGLIAWRGQWETFVPQWRAVLDREGVQVFHMADFVMEERCVSASGCESPYHGWTRERRGKFIYDLVPIIRDNTLFGVGGLLDVRAYNELAPETGRAEFGHPYHVCFRLFSNSFWTR
jgi:hypothetical protein